MRKGKPFLSSLLYIIQLVFYIYSEEEILMDTKINNWKGWTKLSPVSSGWRQQSKAVTAELVYGICPTINESNQYYWLFSNVIHKINFAKSIHIRLKFTIRDCRELRKLRRSTNCDNTFTLYANLLSSYDHDSSYYNVSKFEKITVIRAAYSWTASDGKTTHSRMNSWHFEWPVQEKLFQNHLEKNILILGFEEDSDCVVLHEVKVTYNMCPELRKGLVILPKTSAGTQMSVSYADPKCRSGASIDSSPQKFVNADNYYCLTQGIWNKEPKEDLCQCQPGYFRLNESVCLPCPSKTYKMQSGDTYCQKCPENTLVTGYGRRFCECLPGYYRNLEKDLLSEKCTAPPLPPKDFSVTLQTSFYVNLSWSYPADTGGRDDIIFHLVCANDASVNIYPNPLGSSLSAVVSKLKPGVGYMFHLYTLNGVSKISDTMQDRVKSLVVNTDQLEKPKNLTWTLSNDNFSGLLQWENSNPMPPNSRCYSEISITIQMDIEKRSTNKYQTRNTSIVLQHLITGIMYEAKVRFLLDGSVSPESDGLLIYVPGKRQTDEKKQLPHTKVTPAVSWILIGNLLVIAFLLLICLIFIILYRRQKRSYSRLAKPTTGEWNNQISLQRMMKRSSSRSLREIVTSDNSIYNILSSSSSDNSPLCFKQSRRVILRSRDLPYREDELLFQDGNMVFYRGTFLINNENVPVSVCRYAEVPDSNELNSLISSLPLISNIKCRYVAKLFGYNFSPSNIALLFENLENSTLEDYLKNKSDSLNVNEIRKIFKDIMSAFICLFKMIIQIKKISLKSFWLSEDLTCKIQILSTQFSVENPQFVNIEDLEYVYKCKMKETIEAVHQTLSQEKSSVIKNEISDLFMSLISTCSQNNCSLTDILTVLS